MGVQWGGSRGHRNWSQDTKDVLWIGLLVTMVGVLGFCVGLWTGRQTAEPGWCIYPNGEKKVVLYVDEC